MTAQQLADLLTNKECSDTIPALLLHEAKANNLVIAWTDNDDEWYLNGALEGTFSGPIATDVVLVSKHGCSFTFDNIDCNDKDGLRIYFQHEKEWAELEPEWDVTDDYTLTFAMASPHATFELTDDGDPFCRGIVFSLDTLIPSEVD